MRKTLASIVCACSLMFSGCDNSNQSKTQAPGISETLQESWPLWKIEDLEINKMRGGSMLSYDHTLNIKPDFYKGSMPLNYTGRQTMSFGGFSEGKMLSHEFNEFSNFFIYKDRHLLIGAVTVNNKPRKSMLAEARINYLPSEGPARIELEEFQYNDGLLVFHSKSDIDNSTGFKKNEREMKGKKVQEYYFILPLGLGAR